MLESLLKVLAVQTGLFLANSVAILTWLMIYVFKLETRGLFPTVFRFM